MNAVATNGRYCGAFLGASNDATTNVPICGESLKCFFFVVRSAANNFSHNDPF